MLTRRLLVPLVAVPFALGTVLTGPASAAPSPESAFVTAGVDQTAAQATVKIVRGKWSKDGVVTGYVRPGTCTKAKSLAITNTTAVKQTFLLNGKAAGAVPARKTVVGCISAARPGTSTLKLVRSGDTLKVTIR